MIFRFILQCHIHKCQNVQVWFTQCDGNDLHADSVMAMISTLTCSILGRHSLSPWMAEWACPPGTSAESHHLLARQALTRSLIISWPVRRSLALLNLFVSCDWHSAITCVMSQRCLCHRVDCQTCSGTGGMMETVPSHWCASCHSTVVGDVL